jgi:hypothetical protein
LERDGNSGERAWWVSLLSNGLTREEAVRRFFDSPESRTKNNIIPDPRDYIAITGLYNILNRPSDAAGVRHWLTALRVGVPLAAIRSFFLASPELSNTINTFVSTQYTRLFRMSPTPAVLTQVRSLVIGDLANTTNVLDSWIKNQGY